MISNKPSVENPVGPETPSWEFSWPLGQVLLGLFVIAVGLTIWQQYESRYVGPRTPVAWQSFELDRLEQARRQNQDVLLAVTPANLEQAVRQIAVTGSRDFQQFVFVNLPLPLKIESPGDAPADVRQWLDETVPQIRSGGLAWFPRGQASQCRWLDSGELTAAAAVSLMSDGDSR